MARLSLAIWMMIGVVLMATYVLLDVNHMLTSVISGASLPRIEQVEVSGESVVPGGRMAVMVGMDGPGMTTAYVDLTAIGGRTVDLRSNAERTQFSRENIPVPAAVSPGAYEIDVVVMNQDRRARKETVEVTIRAGVAPVPVRTNENPSTASGATVTRPLPTLDAPETLGGNRAVVVIPAKDRIQLYWQQPLDGRSIDGSGGQFMVRHVNNYFSTIPVTKAMINSTGHVLTLEAKGLEEGTHYTLSLPTTPLRGVNGEEVMLEGPVVFQYVSTVRGILRLERATQRSHRMVEVVLTHAVDMASWYGGEPACYLWSPQYQRIVGYGTRVVPVSERVVHLHMEQTIPMTTTELVCRGLRGTHRVQSQSHIMRTPVTLPTDRATKEALLHRSDFNGDGVIDKEDLTLLLEAMGTRL